jgi:hypothetical protein
MTATILQGDCLEVMRSWETGSIDLVVCSPPYEAARTYGIDFALRGQDWVDWAKERFLECLRVCNGLVCWVVEGQTRQFRYSATPALLMADLHRAGVHLRKPPIYHRVGIPGSGGPDWLRNDYEFCICATNGGKLPWSDNTSMGHPPKWAPGGAMSNRLSNGSRVNQWGHSIDSGVTVVAEDGVVRSKGKRPSHHLATAAKLHTKTEADGTKRTQGYNPPTLANPGNIIKVEVGGGLMGSDLSHENEAPFPESLAEWFVRSFCKPGGIVCDPFSGSGTTAAVALRTGRNFIGIDIRESQVELTKRRIAEIQPELPGLTP